MPRRPVPILAVSGFLSSGKTTFCNALLETGARGACVVLDDFGPEALRGLAPYFAGETSGLPSGGEYFRSGGDAAAALTRGLAAFPEAEFALVELNGLAPTKAALEALAAVPGAFLAASVAVADAANLRARFSHHQDETGDQVANADIVMVSKTDVAPESEYQWARDFIRCVNPRAAVMAMPKGRLDAARFLDVAALTEPGRLCECAVPGRLDFEKFRAFAQSLPESCVSAYGDVTLPDGASYRLSKKGPRLVLTSLPAGSVPSGNLCFVGDGLPRATLASGLLACLA